MKIEITGGAAEVHKKSSTILTVLFAFITAVGPTIVDAWNFLPDDMKAALPEGAARWSATAAFLVLLAAKYTHVTLEKKS